MSHWEKSDSQRAGSWRAPRDLGADVALVQEAVPPPDLDNVVYRPIGGSRPWGSAVVGLTTLVGPVTQAKGRANPAPVDLLRTHPGTVAIGRCAFGDAEITLVSLYGLIKDGYADTTVHRQLSDLVPLLDAPGVEDRLVIGGDLNITTQWVGREARYRDWEQATFARTKAFGLVDCVDLSRADGALENCGCADGDACRHVRTQYHGRSPRPWQNDYAFASGKLVETGTVVAATVVDNEELRGLSSRLPIVLELLDSTRPPPVRRHQAPPGRSWASSVRPWSGA